MPSVLEQCTSALQQKRFTEATALAGEALAGATAVARLPLLEVLAQAQTGLQEHAAAAQTWQRAYEQAATPADKARSRVRPQRSASSRGGTPLEVCTATSFSTRTVRPLSAAIS